MPSCNIWNIVTIFFTINFWQPQLLFFNHTFNLIFFYFLNSIYNKSMLTILLIAECVSSEAMAPSIQISRSPFFTPAFSAAPPFTGLTVNLPFSPTSQIKQKWHTLPPASLLLKRTLQTNSITEKHLFCMYLWEYCSSYLPAVVCWGPGQVHPLWCGRDEEVSILPHG